MKIGITGGIGSGKSYICRKLAERGIEVYDCDSAAKRLMRSSADIRDALTALIGADAYIGQQLNKPVVAKFLLQSDANAKAIDAIVHPAVANDFKQSGCQWMECAIMFESGFNHLVDRVIAVTAPESVRIERIMKRDNITREMAQNWIARQWPQDKVRALSHHEIINDGLQDIDQQIEKIINNL